MGIIRLHNISCFSYHGCLVEESKIGSDYRVDLEVKADLRKPSLTDRLTDTVDYVHLNRIVREEMDKRSALLEHVSQRIIRRVLDEIAIVSWVKVSVSKINPPIGGDVEWVSVEMEESRVDSAF